MPQYEPLNPPMDGLGLVSNETLVDAPGVTVTVDVLVGALVGVSVAVGPAVGVSVGCGVLVGVDVGSVVGVLVGVDTGPVVREYRYTSCKVQR
jgi:hypothetical protein